MTPENFCYWLQGWFELNKTIDHREGASVQTLQMIEAHLQEVFKPKVAATPATPFSFYSPGAKPSDLMVTC